MRSGFPSCRSFAICGFTSFISGSTHGSSAPLRQGAEELTNRLHHREIAECEILKRPVVQGQQAGDAYGNLENLDPVSAEAIDRLDLRGKSLDIAAEAG